MRAVNIYDFDHTIYRGDSSIDFIIFCFMRRPSLAIYTPKMAWSIVLYVFGARSKEQVKQSMFSFLGSVEKPEALVDSFWSKNMPNIKQWYLSQKDASDIIITASPKFLVAPALETLSIKNIIATDVDIHTGKVSGKNCAGTEKIRRLREAYPDTVVRNAYGDSQSDIPMFEVAQHGYLVKGDNVSAFRAHEERKKTIFKSRSFIRFLAVGAINACIGVSFSYIMSLFIGSPQIAFITGFSLSLIPSYFLNSTIAFRDRSYTLSQFSKFVVSYLPNFLIQLLLVHGLTSIFNPYPLVTYVVAVAIATPITFTLLSLYVFRREHS